MSDNHPVEEPDVTDPEITPPYAGRGLLDGADADAETGAEHGAKTGSEHGAKAEAGPGAEHDAASGSAPGGTPGGGEGIEPAGDQGVVNGEVARPPSHSVFADPENPFAVGGRRGSDTPDDATPDRVVSIAGHQVKRKTLVAVLALWIAVFVGGVIIGDVTSRPAADVAQADRQQTTDADDNSSPSALVEGRRWRTATTAPPEPSTNQPSDDQAPDTGDAGEARSGTTTTTEGSNVSDSEPSEPDDRTTTTTTTTSTTTSTTTTTITDPDDDR